MLRQSPPGTPPPSLLPCSVPELTARVRPARLKPALLTYNSCPFAVSLSHSFTSFAAGWDIDPNAIKRTYFNLHRAVGAGENRGSQLVAWSAQAGAAPVLDQVTDAAALAWHAEESCWQLLSPIFGVLMIRQAGMAAPEAASLPVTPLLEAAVERQRSGAPESLWSSVSRALPPCTPQGVHEEMQEFT